MSRWTARGTRALAATTMLVLLTGIHLRPGPPSLLQTASPLPEPIVLNDNGAWSWFEDERAVVDEATGTLLVSSVADDDGTGGSARAGNVEVVAYNLTTGTARRTVLHAGLQADDHNSAALFVRPDGRYVAMFSRHETDRLTRWRVSRRCGDSANWSVERHLEPASTARTGGPTSSQTPGLRCRRMSRATPGSSRSIPQTRAACSSPLTPTRSRVHP